MYKSVCVTTVWGIIIAFLPLLYGQNAKQPQFRDMTIRLLRERASQWKSTVPENSPIGNAFARLHENVIEKYVDTMPLETSFFADVLLDEKRMESFETVGRTDFEVTIIRPNDGKWSVGKPPDEGMFARVPGESVVWSNILGPVSRPTVLLRITSQTKQSGTKKTRQIIVFEISNQTDFKIAPIWQEVAR